MEYIIYKVVNNSNGCAYIGATTDSLEKRKHDHLKKVRLNIGQKFHEEVRTFGEVVFIWEQIDTANNIDELAQKEKQYILEYNSKEQGYNADSGGGFKKTVYQYNLDDGSLVQKYDCLDSACNAVNAIKQQLSRACLSVNKAFGGYYWSYEYEEPFNPKLDNRKKSIIQYDMNDIELNIFNSVAEASKITSCNKSSIAKVCRGERNHAGGFKWSYK